MIWGETHCFLGNMHINLCKLWYFTDLDFPERRRFPLLSYLLGWRRLMSLFLWVDQVWSDYKPTSNIGIFQGTSSIPLSKHVIFGFTKLGGGEVFKKTGRFEHHLEFPHHDSPIFPQFVKTRNVHDTDGWKRGPYNKLRQNDSLKTTVNNQGNQVTASINN